MTEIEWLASGAPSQMLNHLAPGGSPRKRRLFGCACCRRIWNLLSDERSRGAVRAAELFADGKATPKQLDAAKQKANEAYKQSRRSVRTGDTFQASATVVRPFGRSTPATIYIGYRYKAFGTGACLCAAGTDPYSSLEETDGRPVLDWQDAAETALDAGAKWHGELTAICHLLREIFGNPFCPGSVARVWRTPEVIALARGIYAERAFDRMPILADALQKAGCDRADILDHCRDTGATHIHGCWVVDLLLGKKK
jgi:hypothetical protein